MPGGSTYELARLGLGDGEDTTVYLVRHPRAETSARVVRIGEPRRLDHWCAANGHPEAIVAGFFMRDPWRPLGEAWVDGAAIAHEPIAGRWGPERACVHLDGDVRIAARKDLPAEPGGDLVQAGPLLVSGGRSLMDGGLSLAELARLMISFGADEAINLDGGGSATLVHRGHLLNRPYSNWDQPAPESRPVVTALLFDRTSAT